MRQDAISQDRKKVIRTAYFLGYAGALPFIGLSLLVLFADERLASFVKLALHLYGAIILSFLGGLHWGRIASQNQFASSDRWVLAYSVVPSLIGWSSYLLVGIWRDSVWFLIIGYILAYYIDRQFLKDGKWAPFMGSLRFNLTVIACLSLTVSY